MANEFSRRLVAERTFERIDDNNGKNTVVFPLVFLVLASAAMIVKNCNHTETKEFLNLFAHGSFMCFNDIFLNILKRNVIYGFESL